MVRKLPEYYGDVPYFTTDTVAVAGVSSYKSNEAFGAKIDWTSFCQQACSGSEMGGFNTMPNSAYIK